MTFAIPVDDNLTLRLVEPRHAEEIFSIVAENRDHLGRWLPWIETTHEVADTRAWAEDACQRFARQTGLPLSILLDGCVVGGIGLQQISSHHGTAEIGWWLAQHCQGQGIVTRCGRHLMRHAFHERGIHRIYAYTAVANTRSSSVAERLGMRREGELRQAARTREGFVDVAIYARLADD